MADAGGNELKEAYKDTKREANAAVAKAKGIQQNGMTRWEGEWMIYKVANERTRSRRDIGK